ncbi:amidohydrolase family protein [Pectinatus cerevisiiphilus]|uniref:L-fuconolactonase n=1 Tax=Pectinatus cerevisiiphilus TaxID=86956 RepID=A0A4R3K6V5_9FIRM|nr:amidohydrolase family protein [Pectinatus cerevisiiphilus]TCS78421.1 L-fuconolactonase [Pectinatus cerevisiiphilus]
MAVVQKIIDTHNHLWKFENNDNFSWIKEGMDCLRRDFGFQDLQKVLAANDISGSILVQAIAVTEESEKLLALAQKEELIKGVIGWCDISKGPEIVQMSIDNLKSKGTFLKGIRFMSQGLPGNHLLEPNFIAGCRTVGRNNLVYELLVTTDQLPYAIRLVEKCPDVTFVLEHIAKPAIKKHDISLWQKNIKKLAAVSDKIYCKISGMVTEADWHNWQQADFDPYIDTIYKFFGENRIMFGSDWPVSLTAAKYSQVVNILHNWLSRHQEVNPDKLFFENAIKVYHLY